MAAQATLTVPNDAPTATYPPSWVDRMQLWAERLPIPWWSAYLFLAAGLSGTVSVVMWRAGVYASVGFHPMQVWLAILGPYLLWLMHLLNRLARTAMERFRPAFRGEAAEFEAAVYRLTHMPARPFLVFTIIATVMTLPLGAWEMSQTQTGGLERVPPLFWGLLTVLYIATYPFLFHVFHQLRQIHVLHRDWAVIRLSNIRPMYALSQVTAVTALGIVGNSYGWLAAQPGADLGGPVALYETIFNLGLALIVFVWPLWSAHRRLVEAKESVQAAAAERRQILLDRIHAMVDAVDVAEMPQYNQALQAANTELADLARVATWPWSPGTLRNLLGAILLPIVLWLIQFGLGRLLA
jgi:hypothetical protein